MTYERGTPVASGGVSRALRLARRESDDSCHPTRDRTWVPRSSLFRNSPPLGPYSWTMPRILGGSQRDGRFPIGRGTPVLLVGRDDSGHPTRDCIPIVSRRRPPGARTRAAGAPPHHDDRGFGPVAYRLKTLFLCQGGAFDARTRAAHALRPSSRSRRSPSHLHEEA